jgi:hypothetical protein
MRHGGADRAREAKRGGMDGAEWGGDLTLVPALRHAGLVGEQSAEILVSG